MDEAPGLRERKLLAAMHRIQDAALDLFDAHGYAAVTVEQIAAASEVSPSSVYRYFGTKERILLWDEYDPLIVEHLVEELGDASPLAAARRVMLKLMAEVLGQDEPFLRRRMRHLMSDAALEAEMARQVQATSELVGKVVAARLGRPHEDLEIQVFSHAVVGGLLGGLHHWHGTGFREPLLRVLERSFDLLETGLR